MGPLRFDTVDDHIAEIDDLRRLPFSEPRGHTAMYGGFVTEPADTGAHLGVLCWHRAGFSTACGDGTIAFGTWALQSALVPAAQIGLSGLYGVIFYDSLPGAGSGGVVQRNVTIFADGQVDRVLNDGPDQLRDAVTPVITGRAHLTGEHTFVVDPDDELTPGFVLP